MWGELLSARWTAVLRSAAPISRRSRAAPFAATGGAGPAHRGQLRGLCAFFIRDKCWKCTAARTGAVLHRLRRKLQLDFFDHFLKGRQNGWAGSRACCSRAASGERFVRARERMALKAPSGRPSISILINNTSPVTSNFFKDHNVRRDGRGVTSRRRAEKRDGDHGPSALKLFMSSSTRDAIFLSCCASSTARQGGRIPGRARSAYACRQGWLRASHRKLDVELSRPHRPWHTHDEKQPLKPAQRSSSTSRSGRPASCAALPRGADDPRQGLRIQGEAATLSNMKNR